MMSEERSLPHTFDSSGSTTHLPPFGSGKTICAPGKRAYDKFFVYIPTEIARDGLFPFQDGDEVLVKVDRKLKRVILERST